MECRGTKQGSIVLPVGSSALFCLNASARSWSVSQWTTSRTHLDQSSNDPTPGRPPLGMPAYR
jgi:hypothetical protein